MVRLQHLAVAAGTATMQHYHAGMRVERKSDQSPVTIADRAAHAIIVEGLHDWDPTVPVISEEGNIPPLEVRSSWDRFWLVDPLDGTKEFIQQNGEFTVNIALIDEGEPVLGVIYAPALDLLYYAGKGWEAGSGRAWRAGADHVPPAVSGQLAAGGREPLPPLEGAGGVPRGICRSPSGSRPAARSSSAG